MRPEAPRDMARRAIVAAIKAQEAQEKRICALRSELVDAKRLLREAEDAEIAARAALHHRAKILLEVQAMMRHGKVDDAALLAEKYQFTDEELNS